MAKRFRVTYEVVTPESAEHGDAAERGFIAPGGWRTSAGNPEIELGLREAIELVAAGVMEDCGQWFTEADGRLNYETGASERRSLHAPDNITAASYARLARLLVWRPAHVR